MSDDAVTVYLGLGSNLGDRRENLAKALRYLGRRLHITAISSVYDTAPMDNAQQPRFLNVVCRARTSLTPQGLLVLAKGLEAKLGRQPRGHNSPRPIDIDILLYGDKEVKTADLVIPHPEMSRRMFVLVPLAEIAPGLVHPVSKLTIEELMGKIKKDQGIVRLGDKLDGSDEICEGKIL